MPQPKYSHLFLLEPNHWIGQGKLTFSVSPQHLRFYTKWVVDSVSDGVIRAHQSIEQEGDLEHLHNEYLIKFIDDTAFEISLSNDLLGKIVGKGLLTQKSIAWEFRVPSHQSSEAFEGFEVFELQDNGDYMLHAEYLTGEKFRTIIDARIWKKSE